MKVKYGSMEKKVSRWGVIFVMPALLFFSLFSFYPIINAFITSLYDKKILSLNPPDFVLFKNYAYLLKSPDFWNSIRATLVFTGGTFTSLLVISLLLAVCVLNVKRGQNFFQMVFYSPAVFSSVVAAVIWFSILDPRGLANQFINSLCGTPGVDHKWLSDIIMLQISTMVVYFWKYIGYFVVLFVTGLSSIPGSLYESAEIDGAGKWSKFWFITLPLLKPTIILVSIVAMLQCLKTFSTQYLFIQAGATQNPINVITLNIFNTSIRDQRIGLGCAMSIILLIIMVLLTWLQFKISKADDTSY
jgi:multiple sugar transport system permease protein